MALKPNKTENPYGQMIGWKFASAVERGGIASVSTSPTRAFPGDPLAVAAYAADASAAKPLGMLLYDVVTLDTNRNHENWYKSGYQARVGMPVVIDRLGFYHTNFLKSGDSPSAGQPAYLYDNGYVSTTQKGGTAPRVGTFMSSVDANGFVALQVEL